MKTRAQALTEEAEHHEKMARILRERSMQEVCAEINRGGETPKLVYVPEENDD